MNTHKNNWQEIKNLSRTEEEEADYIDDQNNSNTGYNEDLLKYELSQAKKEKEYSFENDYDQHSDSDYNTSEINENEKYATD